MKEEKSAEYKNAIESLETFIMIKWANDTTIVPKVEICQGTKPLYMFFFQMFSLTIMYLDI